MAAQIVGGKCDKQDSMECPQFASASWTKSVQAHQETLAKRKLGGFNPFEKY